MADQILIPEVLMGEAERILQLMFNTGNPAMHWTFHQPLIQPGERLVYEWDKEGTVYYARSGQSFADHGIEYDVQRDKIGTYPRLVMENIHVPEWAGVDWGQAEELAPPTKETRTSQAVTLYPGDHTDLRISDTFSKTTTLLEASKTAIEEAIKLRLGNLYAPVGGELSTTVTEEYSRSFSDSEQESQVIDSTVEVVNETDKPFRVHLEATRRIAKERRHCAIKANFDYSVKFFPLRDRLQGRPFVWGSKSQFLSSMRGLEPDSVANHPNPRLGSFSAWCRERPQPGAAIDPLNIRIEWAVEYSRAIDTSVEQVRTDLDGNPI